MVETIAGGPINGPWDMTAVDHGFLTTLYVTNVLNGTVKATTNFGATGPEVDRGTVVRIELLTLPGVRPIVLNEDVIATGFAEETDPNALVIGPTGVALGREANQVGQPSSGEPRETAAVRELPDRQPPVTLDAMPAEIGAVQALAAHRLHRVAEEALDVSDHHGAEYISVYPD